MACLFLSGRRLNATSRCQTDACERSEASPEFARGGSNAIGTFHPFLDDDVAMHGVEAGGAGLTTAKHAASLCAGSEGVFHGMLTYLLQDAAGQVQPTHSISAGLDYPGVGPQATFFWTATVSRDRLPTRRHPRRRGAHDAGHCGLGRITRHG